MAADPPAFVWTGDPDDEEFCDSVPGYFCHTECMSDGKDPDDPTDHESWYCGVFRGRDVGRETVFHQADADILPLTAKAARELCELAVLADLYRKAATSSPGQPLPIPSALPLPT